MHAACQHLAQTDLGNPLKALAGQCIVGLLAGAGRERNLFYKPLEVITPPLMKLTHLVTRRRVSTAPPCYGLPAAVDNALKRHHG